MARREQIGQVVKWPTTTDCKSVLLRVRWFESILAHIANRSFSGGWLLIKFLKLISAIANRVRSSYRWRKFRRMQCGSSSVGRATAFQAVGRGFEPRLPLGPESKVNKSLRSKTFLYDLCDSKAVVASDSYREVGHPRYRAGHELIKFF